MSEPDYDKINRIHCMDDLLKHPFLPIRFIEFFRRVSLINLIEPKRNDVIGDIGCESGHIASLLFKKYDDIKVLCVDLSSYALKMAKKRAKREGWVQKAKFIKSDAQSLKINDNSIDISISSNLLEHLPDPEKGIRELVRITKPNGKIIINLPNEKQIIFMKKLFMRLGLSFLLRDLKVVTPGHIHYPDKKWLKGLVKNYAEIEKIFLGPIPFFGPYIYARLKPKKDNLL